MRPDALSIPRAGLYPVTIELQRDGRILSTVLTFINRLPAAGEAADDIGPLSVAVAVGTQSTVHLDSKGTTSVDNASTIDGDDARWPTRWMRCRQQDAGNGSHCSSSARRPCRS